MCASKNSLRRKLHRHSSKSHYHGEKAFISLQWMINDINGLRRDQVMFLLFTLSVDSSIRDIKGSKKIAANTENSRAKSSETEN